MAVLANFALVPGTAASAQGPVKFNLITFTGPTYAKSTDPAVPTGNTGLAAGLQGLTKDARKPIAVIPQGSAGDYALEYNPVNDRLKAVVASTGTEIANNVDLSGVTFRVLVISN